ncbi:MAG TPA: phage holin family protein [Candidatus Udaeobacter sp.]|nr:phage holin family protein [Candidatus Udaeobacter sp.]
MISKSPRSSNPAGHVGLLGNLLALINALAAFFESRFALVAEESKSAAVQLLILAGCLIFALLLCALGYVFLITGAVVGIAHLAGISWPWIALAAAALHFIIALVLLLIARNRITKPFFRATMAELKKDREWLKNLQARNQSTN